jgi:hypothetical protein
LPAKGSICEGPQSNLWGFNPVIPVYGGAP